MLLCTRIRVAQSCNEAGARVACSHKKSTCVSDSLIVTSTLHSPWHREVPWPKLFPQTYFSSVYLSLSLSLLPLCLVLMGKRRNIFPGNLLYLQSSDMAARPLLINSPLNFNRLIINYWGINVQIQLCCPSSVHECQQRYFMAYVGEHSVLNHLLLSHLSFLKQKKKMFF